MAKHKHDAPPDADAAKHDAPPDADAALRLVRMVRPGGNPSTADVHPAEVANYALGGWEKETK